jgi:hypothetical protein
MFEQNIVWIQENTPQNKVLEFLNAKIQELNTDIILFERPFGIKTKLVKPSFPFIRHIHLWTKNFDFILPYNRYECIF